MIKYFSDTTMKHSGLRTVCLLVAIGIVLPLWPAPQKTPAKKSILQAPKLTEKDLPAPYRDFLTRVTYIITSKEKEVFLQLTSDRDRDIFIGSFWKIRDPTPSTPENEYKIEQIKRFEYANKTYGRGAGRPGWMTDRGKYYIILGPPASTERFDSVLGLRPCEVWYYYSEGQKSLPLHFGLVFFQKGGAGEYRLYDPFVDGPKSLMNPMVSTANIDPEDYEAQHEALMDIAPTLADMAISLIPGEYGFGFTPTSRNTVLIATILDSPKADIKPAYATHFLNYKGLVSTEYMSNFVESDAVISILTDTVIQAPFVHFSIKPASVSVDYYAPKDQYFCAFSISVSLRPADRITGEPVFQYSRDYPFYFPANEVEKVRSNGISIEDSFPIVPGKYRLTILLQNAVGKEFSLSEKDIVVAAPGSEPRLAGPAFGYRIQASSPNVFSPFQFGEKKIMTDPRNTFGRKDTIVCVLQVENAEEDLGSRGIIRLDIRGSSGKPEDRKSMEIRLKDFPATRDFPIIRTLEAGDLVPDYYEVRAVWLDVQGKTRASSQGQFIVSSADKLGHPIPRMRAVPANSRYMFYGMLAQQFAAANDNVKADLFYEKTFELKPDFTRGMVEFASFLLASGRSDKCLAVVERFKNDGALRFEYLSIRGKALAEKGLFAEAADTLLQATRVYNSDTSVLNTLGLCFFKQKKKTEALDSLRASLSLNPDQEAAKKLIAEIETTLK
jgi:GWxTD domain-containing protein